MRRPRAGDRRQATGGRRLAMVLACVVGAGCAGPKAHLTADLIERLPTEGRAAIYDRENDVTIAKNRRDEAQGSIERIEEELAQLSERLKKAEARLAKMGFGGRAGQLRSMVDARKGYLEAQLKVAEAQLEGADLEVAASQARLEQAKERQLVRFGLAPETGLGAFDAEAERLDKRSREAERKEADVRAQAQKVFVNWKLAEDAYVAATGDHDAMVWVD